MPFHLDLESTPESATRARRGVRAFLEAEWPQARTDDVLRDLADDVELATAELVTNSVRHGATPVSLSVTLEHHGQHRAVTVVVRDGGTWGRTVSDAGSDDEGGRGLLLVQALSTRFEVVHERTGTCVSALLERTWPALTP